MVITSSKGDMFCQCCFVCLLVCLQKQLKKLGMDFDQIFRKLLDNFFVYFLYLVQISPYITGDIKPIRLYKYSPNSQVTDIPLTER